MEKPHFEDQSFDCFIPSWNQFPNNDWNGPVTKSQTDDSIQLPAYEAEHEQSEHEQKIAVDSEEEWKRQSLDLLTKGFNSARTSTDRPSEDIQCCAFRKLEDVLRTPMEKKDTLSRKGPCHRLVTWVAICRDEDPELNSKVKRSCPLAKCTFACDPNDGELIRHILSCSFLKHGKYNCPYHKEVETFMIAQPRRQRKRWNRSHSLREAFKDICKLGSKGLHKAFGHSNKKRRFETLEVLDHEDASPHAFEIGDSQSDRKRITNSHLTWSEKRQPPVRRSEALQSRIQSQVREADDTVFVSELDTNLYSELPGQELDLCNELPSIRLSAAPQDLPPIITSFDSSASNSNSETDTFLPSPLSSTQYVSTERFESPISPQEVKGVVKWAEAIESSSGHQASLDAVVFGWPMNQKQSVQSIPSIAGSRSPNARLRAKGLQALCIDTSVGSTKPVAAPKSLSPVTMAEQFPSSPDNPEVLSYEPSKLFEELRSTVKNTYTFTYAQLSRPPQLPISKEIISMQLTPSDVFSSGWEAVEKVLHGQLPHKFWWLFSLAQLAFACGQAVWESRLKDHMDEIVDDLKIWSYALRSPRERQCYIDVIEQIFIHEERSTTVASSSTSQDGELRESRRHRDTLYLDGRELLSKLKNGIVIRLCLQFLCTFELLQYRLDRINNASVNGLASLLQTTDENDHNVAILHATVIRPLQAKAQFQELSPVIEKAADLLCDYPNTSSRELELFLVCHSRYYTQDHALHLQFRKVVAECCSDASIQLTGIRSHPDNYLLQDIAAVRQCQQSLASASWIKSTQNSASYSTSIQHTPIQELQGSPVAFSQPLVYTFQQRFGAMYTKPQSSQQRRPQSHIQTPISATTASPSTAASSHAPSIWTPNSAHSISPATATEPRFPSPYTSMCWPTGNTPTIINEEPCYTDPNFPLTTNDDYTLLTNEFLNDDPSLFDPEPMSMPEVEVEQPMQAQPEAISLPVSAPIQEISPHTTSIAVATAAPLNGSAFTGEAESKASLSCNICHTTFTGKEQFLASNLRRHMRELHSSAAKGLTCEVCQKAFTRKHNLNVHLKTVHAGGKF